MRAFWGGVALAICAAGPATAASTTALRGYAPADAAAERAVEAQYLDLPTAASALDFVRAIAARTHYAGTPGDYALALYMRDQMRGFGIRADLIPFSARVDTPRELVLELAPPAELAAVSTRTKRGKHADFPVALNLAETGDPADSASGARAAGLPFNAGSADGDVTAPLVYAGRGLDADYDVLARAHVDVRGAVVLLRYGAEFRGGLAARAQARGAAGAIFYSDPQDDGSARGLVAPQGPWLPRTAVERGWIGTGIRIPVLPISAANAQVLLASLGGSPGPPGWSGALPVDYPLARGPGRVHLIVVLNRKPTTLWNTVGVIAGQRGDQSVILGAGRDAWVYGAGANGSGVATVLDVARGLGYLMQSGWRPQRTVILAGWDGSEVGTLGSHDYVFTHRFAVPRGCVAYLNAERTAIGPLFDADATAALAPLLASAAQAVPNPLTPAATLAAPVRAPGGGGDDENFLTTAGIPVAGMRLDGPFGVGGTSFDTLQFATTVSDPYLALHRTAAQLYGIVTLRLADAVGVPYDFRAYPTLISHEVAVLRTRARRAGFILDAAATRAALARLDDSVHRFDGRAGASTAWADGLLAVRTLNSLLYGVAGAAPVALPDLSAAVARGDRSEASAALRRTASTIERAAAELGR